MSGSILFLIESEILPGKEAELREVVSELVAHVVATEPGTLRYDWFVDTEAQTLRLVEEYDSFESAMFHGKNYRTYRVRLDELRVVAKRTICGEVSDEAKAMLAPMAPHYFDRL